MKTKTRPPIIDDDFTLQSIFIHFRPRPSGGYSSGKTHRAVMQAMLQTPAGQKRNKEQDAYIAEHNWRRNLSFVAGLYTLIPENDSVLKTEAKKLLLKMFGKGFAKDRLTRFNTAERRRIRKTGEEAWRLVKKLRKTLLPAHKYK